MNYKNDDTLNWLLASLRYARIERDGPLQRLSLWFIDEEQADRVITLLRQLAEGAPATAIDVMATPARPEETE